MLQNIQLLHCMSTTLLVLERGPKKIQEMRTSRPFYQAHQEAHALLESTCLPSFHHSYQVRKSKSNCSLFLYNRSHNNSFFILRYSCMIYYADNQFQVELSSHHD